MEGSVFVEDGQPAPGLYLSLLTYELSRPEGEALASRLKIFRDDLTLLQQVLDLREQEAELDQAVLSNREIYALLQYSSTPALLVVWLCTTSARVRERIWCYETELRHIQPVVDGTYLKSLGLKLSPLFSQLLHAVRDARLDGQIHSEEEEKTLIGSLLAEREEG
jgi:tRNA nucleotidyltransferase (CCA-adding enzyme)